jgi:acyl-CoA synthetase (AMP-forming)/AMP-acid ligase II
VFPAEVENFLLTHPDIAQAAVIGVPHQTMGESLEAFVVLTPGAKLESGDVVRFAREGIAGYKVPYAVRVLDKLPLLPSGKPDRRALARDAERKRAVA